MFQCLVSELKLLDTLFKRRVSQMACASIHTLISVTRHDASTRFKIISTRVHREKKPPPLLPATDGTFFDSY